MVFWFTAVVIILMTVLLVLETADTALILFGTMMVFVITGIITPAEAFTGFSNQGMLAIGFLYILAYSVQSTGILNSIGSKLLGKPNDREGWRQVRLLYPVGGISAFMNNTPIVAMFIPVIKQWCRRFNVAPSRYLIPLSYATLLGGVCTLIGTSTNLVIHGFLIQHGLPGFSFFELGSVGLPLMVIGIAFIILVVRHLLPDRKGASITLGENTREFVVALKVTKQYAHIDQSIEEAGLRHLQGLFLFQIERDGQLLTPVGPNEIIKKNDRLFFTGVPSTIVELQREPGLQVIKDVDFELKNYDSNKVRTFEVVISSSSPLVGESVRDSDFRQVYNAVILAIHRNGHRINRKIGDIIIQEGDTLLILAPHHFYNRWYHSPDFLLVSTSEELPSRPKWQSAVILSTLAAMIVLVTLRVLPMVVASAAAVTVLFIFGCLTGREAFESVNWRVLLIIASSFGIASAVDHSGLAAFIAHDMIQWTSAWGLIGLIGGMLFITMIYAQLVTNSAAAAIVFPVAWAAARQLGISIMPLAYALVFGASAGFATPIGYQTNIMVYGPGGYKFTDYLKAGIPMALFVCVVATLLIYWKFGF